MAKNSGIVRCIDDLGRIVVPREYRSSLGIKDGDSLEMTLKGDTITLSRYSKSCTFCENIAEEYMLLGKPICAKCRNKLREQVAGIG